MPMPSHKYAPQAPVRLTDRTWPDAVIDHPPVWVSTDLRDGNQALARPMDVERKRRFFRLLVDVGFRDIEVAFPSASQVEFDFVRHMIESGDVPDDVTLVVLTQCREHLIRRTFESLKGARRAIVHFYNSTNAVQREVVFGLDRDGVKQIAVDAATLCRELAPTLDGTDLRFEYTPESFVLTELDFARDVCDAVVDALDPEPGRRVIVNLPATVEVDTPNVYADRIEWMSRHLTRRDDIELSAHTHNDRGCAVAASELAVMAGAERVEGTLFGNGERTGNADLITMAMNLHASGVAPGLDLSSIDDVRRVAEECTDLPVHPRHPYAGDLVYTAFSGSHQDAIAKGMKARTEPLWTVPYLPIDPADVGRTYEAIVRVNSQSGKGGVAHVMREEHGLDLPYDMRVEFGRRIQQVAEEDGAVIDAERVRREFDALFMEPRGLELVKCTQASVRGGDEVVSVLYDDRGQHVVRAWADGPVAAFVASLTTVAGGVVEVHDFAQHALGAGSDARAVAYVYAGVGDRRAWGAGVDGGITMAAFRAVVAALGRCREDAQ